VCSCRTYFPILTDQSMCSIPSIPVTRIRQGAYATSCRGSTWCSTRGYCALLHPSQPLASLAPSRELLRSCVIPAQTNGSNCAVLPLPLVKALHVLDSTASGLLHEVDFTRSIRTWASTTCSFYLSSVLRMHLIVNVFSPSGSLRQKSST